jgi:hypothetical protein
MTLVLAKTELNDQTVQKLQVALTKVFLSDWIFHLAMAVPENDIFFNYNEDNHLIESVTELIYCGDSDESLKQSVQSVTSVVAMSGAVISRSESMVDGSKVLYQSWFQTYYLFN